MTRRLFRSDNFVLLLVAVVFALAHFATNGAYGFHRDELATLDDARHMAWGFVAYPPFTPAVGRLELILFGNSLFALRVIPTIVLAVVVFVAGLMSRELGGGRRAQILAAISVAIIPIVSVETNVLQYVSLDYLWGTLLTYFILRILNSEDPRWWIAVGAVIGLGMMTKYTMAFFVIGLAVGVFLTPARRFLWNRWLFIGVALSLLIFLPNLIWQIQHQFISLDFLKHIHARDIRWGRTKGFIPEQFFVCISLFTLPLLFMGLWFYFRERGRKYGLFAWMYIATFILFVIAQARSYYLGPLYPVVIAAGVVVWEHWLSASSRTVRMIIEATTLILVSAGTAGAFAFFTPIAAIQSPLFKATAKFHENYIEEIGWPELTQTVAGIYNRLSPDERSKTGILVGNYGEAGAINVYGSHYGLPEAISGTNTNWYRTYPKNEPQTLIVVGFDPEDVKELFDSCELAAHNTNAYGVLNEESRAHPDIFLCHGLRMSWHDFWTEFRRYG